MAVGNIQSFNIGNKLPDYTGKLIENLLQINEVASQQGHMLLAATHTMHIQIHGIINMLIAHTSCMEGGSGV
jgi:hypothetical protein